MDLKPTHRLLSVAWDERQENEVLNWTNDRRLLSRSVTTAVAVVSMFTSLPAG